MPTSRKAGSPNASSSRMVSSRSGMAFKKRSRPSPVRATHIRRGSSPAGMRIEPSTAQRFGSSFSSGPWGRTVQGRGIRASYHCVGPVASAFVGDTASTGGPEARIRRRVRATTASERIPHPRPQTKAGMYVTRASASASLAPREARWSRSSLMSYRA